MNFYFYYFIFLSWLKYPQPIQLSNYFSIVFWDVNKWEGGICLYVYLQ